MDLLICTSFKVKTSVNINEWTKAVIIQLT